MADDRKYRFVGKGYSKEGRASTIIAAVSLVLFLMDAFISFVAGGNAGSIVGVIAIGSMLLSVYGFYVGMKSFADKNVSQTLSIIGSISCGILMIVWLTLLIKGIQ